MRAVFMGRPSVNSDHLDGRVLDRVASPGGKKRPRFRGVHWSLACLFVEECFSSLLVVVRCGLGSAACDKKEQALCQRNPAPLPESNRTSRAPADAKFDFGQYVTSAGAALLSKSSTQAAGWRST